MQQPFMNRATREPVSLLGPNDRIGNTLFILGTVDLDELLSFWAFCGLRPCYPRAQETDVM